MASRPSLRWPEPAWERGAVAAAAPDGPVRLDQPVPWKPPAWTVLEQVAANRALVVEIETDRIDEARQIAGEIVDLVGDRYLEVLIYFHRPGTYAAGGLPARRVQWTPSRGFVEITFGKP